MPGRDRFEGGIREYSDSRLSAGTADCYLYVPLPTSDEQITVSDRKQWTPLKMRRRSVPDRDIGTRLDNVASGSVINMVHLRFSGRGQGSNLCKISGSSRGVLIFAFDYQMEGRGEGFSQNR